jgi:hypothetical protein
LLSQTQRASPGRLKQQTSIIELKTKELLDQNLLNEITRLQQESNAANLAAEQTQANLIEENRSLKEKLTSLTQQ